MPWGQRPASTVDPLDDLLRQIDAVVPPSAPVAPTAPAIDLDRMLGDIDSALASSPMAPAPSPLRPAPASLTVPLSQPAMSPMAPVPAHVPTGPSWKDMTAAKKSGQPPAGGDEESAFRQWYGTMATQHGLNPDPDAPDQFYDYRSAFKAGAQPDASGHWPSTFKKLGHPNEVVGGFNTRTGERVPGTPQASETELVRLGWSMADAAHMSRPPTPQPPQPPPRIPMPGDVLDQISFQSQPIAPTRTPPAQTVRDVVTQAADAVRAVYHRLVDAPPPPAPGEPVTPTLTMIADQFRHDMEDYAVESAVSPLGVGVGHGPERGTKQIGQGVTTMADALATGNDKAAMRGLNDVIEGAFQAAEPIVAYSLVMKPVATLITVGSAVAASEAASRAVTAAGGSEDSARLAGNLAALAAAGKGTDFILKKARASVASAAETARAYSAKVEAERSPTRITPEQTDVSIVQDRQQIVADNPIGRPSPPPEAPGPLAGEPPPTGSSSPVVPRAPSGLAAPEPIPSPDDLVRAIDTALGTTPQEPPAAQTPPPMPVADRPGPLEAVGPVAPSQEPLPVAPAAPAVSPSHEHVRDGTTVQPVAPPASRPPEDVLTRVQGKLANGDRLGTDEARAAFAERQRVDAVRSEEPDLNALVQQIDKAVGPSKPEGSKPPREFSSTQVDLPQQDADAVRALAQTIPDAALAGDGREDHVHATVKFGLHTADAEDVRRELASEGPIQVTLGKTSTFPPSESSDGAAVIKIDVDSPDLHRLNKKIADALEHTDSFPDYKPHVTVAYVKPELAQQYVGNDSLDGRTITLDAITFSSKDRTETTIPLNGPAQASTPAELPPPTPEGPGGREETPLEEPPSRADNPFRARAIRARELADRLNRPTAHERGMADSFPLGAGYGRPGGEKRVDASVTRAVNAVQAVKDADYLEAQARAYDEGRINAQGRRINPESIKRSDAAHEAQQRRDARIADAKAVRGDKEKWEVPGTVWVDSTGNLGGGARKLLLAEHREAVEAALRAGENVPADVLAEYPNLQPAPKGQIPITPRTEVPVDSTRTAGAESTRGQGGSEPPAAGDTRPDVAGPITGRRHPRRAQAPRVDPLATAADEHFPTVLDDARRHGFTGTDAELRAHYDERVRSAREWIEDVGALRDEHSGTALLKEIRRLGGLRPYENQRGAGVPTRRLRGEFESMVAGFKSNHGQAGASSIFRTDGLWFDDLFQQISESGRFPELRNADQLLEELDRIARRPLDQGFETPDLIGILAGAHGMEPGAQWWADAINDSLSANADEGGDSSFTPPSDVTPIDRLDTGEAQPRLPGAASARQAGKADTTFKAPQQASGDDFNLGAEETPVAEARRKADENPDLFGAEPEPPKPIPSPLDDISARKMGMPSDLKDDINLITDEARWREALKPGGRVTVPGGTIGTVIELRGDPVNGGRVLVEHPYEDIPRAQRWYRATQLDAAESQPRTARQKSPAVAGDVTPRDKPRTAQSSTSGSRGTVTVQSAVIPGLKEFVEDDVTPTLKSAAEDVVAVKGGLRAIFAPDTVSPAARSTAGDMRANIAASAQRIQRAQCVVMEQEKRYEQLAGAAERGDATAREQVLKFTDAMEGVTPADSLPQNDQLLGQLWRELNIHKRHEVQRRGKLQQFIENYFPHVWQQPSKAKTLLAKVFGRNPIGGKKNFLKKRSIPTVREGVELGLEPISWNPVTLMLHKLAEMDKWILAHDLMEDLKAHGTAKFVKIGKKPPEGWQRYHESFGTVYAPPVVKIHEAFDARLMEKLHEFAVSLGITTVRKEKIAQRGSGIGSTAWGYAVENPARIATRFGGPETVLEHEIGHILDWKYGLWEKISKELADERFDAQERNPAQELRDLADLRFEGQQAVPGSFKTYVRKKEEKMANLVHAFIYNPELCKDVAPNAYWALYNLAKDTPELKPLLELQKTKSLVLGTNTTDKRVDGIVIGGYYYGPPEAVKLLNNYLSPGLRGNVAFQLYRRSGNFMNQVQLGMSGFHLTMTGLEAVVSKTAQAVMEVSRSAAALTSGDLPVARRELGHAARTAALAPVATFADLYRGNKLLKEFYATDANAREIATISDLVIQGGGGFHRDQLLAVHDNYSKAFVKAVRRGNYPGAALRAVPALIELPTRFVMEWWVPRLKIAAYVDLARMELRTLGPQPTLEDRRRVLGDVWDSIDNRFGQLVYDNLFWNRTLQDAGMGSVRALGWNVGTVREVGGAPSRQIGQLLNRPVRMKNTGTDDKGNPRYEKTRDPWMTHKFSYIIAMPFVLGLIGAIFQYLHTGSGPDELRDYYFPKTGRKKPDGTDERVSIPGYHKDVYAVTHDLPGSALETAGHKLHPLPNMMWDMFRNEDYFGTEIRNVDDPLVEQAKDLFTYAAKAFVPFTVRSFNQRRDDQDTTTTNVIESLFGITPAPASVTRTKAETLIRKYTPSFHRSQDQAADAVETRQIREGLRSHTPEGRAQAQAAARSGDLTKRQVETAVRAAGSSPLQRGFKRLTLAQALNVYDVATPTERAELRAVLMSKAMSGIENAAPNDRQVLGERIRRAKALPFQRPATIPVTPRPTVH